MALGPAVNIYMILTKQQLQPLLYELNYDFKTSIGFWFRHYHNIHFYIKVDNTYSLNFNSDKEELMFALKYSNYVYKE